MQIKNYKNLLVVAINLIILVLIMKGCSSFLRPLMRSQPIDSKGLKVADFLTRYSIEEHHSKNQRKCYFKIYKPSAWIGPTWIDDNSYYVEFSPPAGVTFQGLAIPTNRESNLPCQYGIIEFVVTDNYGKAKSDKFDLRKIKFKSLKISANTSKQIHIKLLDIAYPKSTDLEIKITSDNSNKNEVYSARVRTDSEQYISDINEKNFSETYRSSLQSKDLPYLDLNTQTLIIPAGVLSRFKLKTATIDLKVKVKILARVRYSSFDYEYTLSPTTIEFQ